MKHPIVWGIVAALVSSASSAVPRYTYQTTAPNDREILEVVRSIDAKLDEAQRPVMQQTNNMNMPEPETRQQLREDTVRQLLAMPYRSSPDADLRRTGSPN